MFQSIRRENLNSVIQSEINWWQSGIKNVITEFHESGFRLAEPVTRLIDTCSYWNPETTNRKTSMMMERQNGQAIWKRRARARTKRKLIVMWKAADDLENKNKDKPRKIKIKGIFKRLNFRRGLELGRALWLSTTSTKPCHVRREPIVMGEGASDGEKTCMQNRLWKVIKLRTTRVQILDETDCISHSTHTLGKGMNPIILPPAMDK